MNQETLNYFNLFLGAGAILLQVVSVTALILLVYSLTKPKRSRWLDFLAEHFLFIGFLISFLASFFSMIYSEIFNFIPCHLCWYQRIFLFPLPLLFLVALWYNHKNVGKYILSLILPGLAISLYQNYFYYFGAQGVSCGDGSVSCYERLVSTFGGYISVPMLALTAFFAILVITLIRLLYTKKSI